MELLLPLLYLAVYLGIPLFLLGLGMFVGNHTEKKHYASIQKREHRYARIPCLNTKTVPEGDYQVTKLCTGSVVISVDRFKQLLGALRNIFGGEVNAYTSLIDRARREALLRMKENYPNADLFVNVRVETMSISKGAKQTVGSVEVLAYGTALRKAA